MYTLKRTYGYQRILFIMIWDTKESVSSRNEALRPAQFCCGLMYSAETINFEFALTRYLGNMLRPLIVQDGVGMASILYVYNAYGMVHTM